MPDSAVGQAADASLAPAAQQNNRIIAICGYENKKKKMGV
jgi:hypothetical protein